MELRFDSGFRVIGEYLTQIDAILRVNLSNCLSILSQPDSNILQILGIPGEFQFVKLTLNIESILLIYSPITRNPGSNFSSPCDNFLGQNESIFSFSAIGK